MAGRAFLAGTPAGPGAPGARVGRIATGLVALAIVVLLWPVLSNPGRLALGGLVSEAPAHLWGLWAAAEGLFRAGPFFRTGEVNHPAGFAADLIDPVSLVVFWPVWRLLGGGPLAAVAAWNALHAATVALAGYGGWKLGRRVLPDPDAALVVVAACAASPYLMASAQLGRTEYLAGAWYPLHLAWLHAHLSPERRPRDTALATLTLAGLAHSGWTLALWVAALEIPIALWFSLQIPSWKARFRRLAEVGLPAILLTLPFLISVVRHSPWWLSRLQPGQAMPVVLVMPLQNLFRFLPSYPVGGGVEVAPYPGTVVPVLMAFGLWYRPRQTLPWLGLAVLLIVCALGPEIMIAQEGGWRWRGYAPIAWLVTVAPSFQVVQNWPRIACLLGAPLGLAAAWGIALTGRRRPPHHLRSAALLGLLIVLDHGTWAQRLHRGAFPVSMPADVAAALAAVPEGALLELPIDNDQDPARAVWEDYSLLWQLQHGRPTSEAPSPRAASAYQVSILAYDLGVGMWPSQDACARSEGTRLAEAGFGAVLLHRRRMQEAWAQQAEQAITAVMGDPAFKGDQVVAWTVEATDEPPDGCKVPLGRRALRR